MNEHYWLALIFIALGSLLFRQTFLLFIKTAKLPSLLQEALDFIPPTVLAALVLPGFIFTEGPVQARLLTGLLALLLAWIFNRGILTIGLSFLLFWYLS
jgi:branched-subunit amino acid transport protein